MKRCTGSHANRTHTDTGTLYAHWLRIWAQTLVTHTPTYTFGWLQGGREEQQGPSKSRAGRAARRGARGAAHTHLGVASGKIRASVNNSSARAPRTHVPCRSPAPAMRSAGKGAPLLLAGFARNQARTTAPSTPECGFTNHKMRIRNDAAWLGHCWETANALFGFRT